VRGIFLLAIVIYLIALNYFGFVIATALFLLFTVNYLTYEYQGSIGNWKQILIRCFILMIILLSVYYLFGDVFNIMLPKGKLL
jgi:hypothetical protein